MRQSADEGVRTYRYVGATARRIDGGWESLGDMGSIDADGYVYLADRQTDMILAGGANVYPAEVEAALDEHDFDAWNHAAGVSDCAAYAALEPLRKTVCGTGQPSETERQER